MPIDAICPKCQTTYRLADNMQGKQVRCKGCQQPFPARAAGAAVLAEEVPAPAQARAGPPARAAAPPPPRTGVHPKAPTAAGRDSGPHRPAKGPAPKKGGAPVALILVGV